MALKSGSINQLHKHRMRETSRWQFVWKDDAGFGCSSNGKLYMNLPWRRKWQPTPAFAWKTPWTEEPGGLQSVVSQRVGHDWARIFLVSDGKVHMNL